MSFLDEMKRRERTMRINTWADEKQLVRDKIEELFRICEDTSARGLEMYIKIDAENAPTMNRYSRSVIYKVPFAFCKDCKEFRAYESNMTCLKDNGCKEAVRLYKKYALRHKCVGQWDETDDRWGIGKWRCSACEKHSKVQSDYCPNCGAKMDGGKDNAIE